MRDVIPTPVDDLALMVWEELSKAGEAGLARWEIQRRVPILSKHQIKRGMDRINHVLQLTREQPIVHFQERGRGVVYRLPRDSMDYRVFAFRRIKELITRSHTELGRAQAAVLCWPEGLPPYLPKMLGRVIEDLGDILLEMVRDDEEDETQEAVGG